MMAKQKRNMERQKEGYIGLTLFNIEINKNLRTDYLTLFYYKQLRSPQVDADKFVPRKCIVTLLLIHRQMPIDGTLFNVRRK